MSTLIALLSALQYVPYFISIARRKTLPSVSAWSCFSLSLLVTILASLQEGTHSILISTGPGFLCQLAIIVVGWRLGVARMPDRAEQLILATILSSVLLWWAFGSPALAIFINLLIDVVGTVLVLRKLRAFPLSEAPATWLMGAIGSGLAVWHFGGEGVTMSHLYLVTLFISNLSVLGMLVWQFSGRRSSRRHG